MSGRLILEYRDGGNVTRLERDVKKDNYGWHDVTRELLQEVAAKSMADLVDAAIPTTEEP